jgi:hypothetical protein
MLAILLLFLAINTVIATWNAYVVGRMWPLAQGFGASLLCWCGLIQSVVGYSSAILLGILFGVLHFEVLDMEYAKYVVDLWYLVIIFPAIGSGICIWLHSVQAMVRNPGFGSFLTAGWNSYAMYHNVSGAIAHVPEAASGVGELFKALGETKGSGGKDGALVILVIVIVAVTLLLSVLLTYMVFSWGCKATTEELHAMRART